MNYEEVLKNRDQRVRHIATTPLGPVYRQMIEGKYTNVLTFRQELMDNCIITADILQECEQASTHATKRQIPLAIMMSKDNTIVGLKLSSDKIASVEQMLINTPAVVAENGFINDILENAFDELDSLHEKGVIQVCMSPQSILIKPESRRLMFITRGSYYLNISDRKLFYKEMEEYIAPEVLNGNDADERSDVYAMGKFIEFLYKANDVPYDIAKVVEKATKEDPDERYQTMAAMRRDLNVKRNLKRCLYTLAAVIIFGGVIVGGMSSLFETPPEIEYVKPAPKRATDDLVERGIDPLMELGLIANDSIGDLTPEQQKEQEEYRKKNEEIFRRRYREAAIRLLGKVYDKQNMNQPQNNFMIANQKALEELARLQVEYGSDAGLDDSKSQQIASQLIEEISNTLK